MSKADNKVPASIVALVVECPSCRQRWELDLDFAGCAVERVSREVLCECGTRIRAGYTSMGMPFGDAEIHKSSDR